MKSNADQFARRGDPWFTPAEKNPVIEAVFSPVTCKQIGRRTTIDGVYHAPNPLPPRVADPAPIGTTGDARVRANARRRTNRLLAEFAIQGRDYPRYG